MTLSASFIELCSTLQCSMFNQCMRDCAGSANSIELKEIPSERIIRFHCSFHLQVSRLEINFENILRCAEPIEKDETINDLHYVHSTPTATYIPFSAPVSSGYHNSMSTICSWFYRTLPHEQHAWHLMNLHKFESKHNYQWFDDTFHVHKRNDVQWISKL